MRNKQRVINRFSVSSNLGVLVAIGFGLVLLAPEAIATPVAETRLTISPVNLLEQGKALYDAGQYTQAITILQQALANYRAQGDLLHQAATLSNLSLVYQELGQWTEAEQSINESLKILRTGGQGSPSERLHLLAQTLDVQGRLQLSRGQTEQALETWQQANTLYTQLKDSKGITRSRINQAQALQSLGLYRRALITLTELKQSLQKQPDSLTKAVALRSLGDALQVVGDSEESRKTLEQSLAIAQKLQSPQDISRVQFSLGNTIRSQVNLLSASEANLQGTRQKLIETALSYYQQAATTSPSPLTQVQARLNQLSLLIEDDRKSEAHSLANQLPPQLDRLPVSRAAIYARINFAQNLVNLKDEGERRKDENNSSLIPHPSSFENAAKVFANAAQQAKQLGDKRAESYAIGSLGGLYEKTGQLANAEDLTEQALVLAQTVNAPDITYRWQWQLGRLLKAQQQIPDAIGAYDAAVATLQSIRGDLVAVNRDVQFSFRESVEPVYRESVELLLRSQKNPDEATLDKARQRIEALQLAELDNFFREACLNAQTVALDKVVDQDNPTAAIIYPILLKDELDVIVKIPKQPLQHYRINRSQQDVEKVAEDLRSAIVQPDESLKTRQLSQELYQWLVQPIEKDLQQRQVNTLVFVLDGALRNIPMSALYDGQQYLVDKYAVSLSIGLQLLDPKPLARGKLKALAAGLVQPPAQYSEFPPLPEIQAEFKFIEAMVPTVKLLEFTRQELAQEINAAPFSVVHLATHGQFSSQAQDTFILAADGPINVIELDKLLRSRDQTRTEAVELLVLSACQTAAGDNRATLGLAGIAIRAGARSTLASLWQIDDRSTALFIGEFYKALASKPNITKAEALRQAQLNLRQNYPDYSDPGYWAPYVLVGNWL